MIKIVDIKKVRKLKSLNRTTSTKLIPTINNKNSKVVRYKSVKILNIFDVATTTPKSRKVPVKKIETKIINLFFTPRIMQKLALIIIFTFSASSLNTIGLTSAYYGDIESTENNSFLGGSLDISLTNDSFEGTIGNSTGDNVEFQTTVFKELGILPTQYNLSYEKVEGSDDVCNALSIEATFEALEYSGALTSLTTTPNNDFGLWNFKVTLLSGETVPLDQKCSFDLVFNAWIDGILSNIDSGYKDTARFHIVINTKDQNPVVLNEFLPNPEGILCADGSDDCSPGDQDFIFDFGKDSDNKPKGEWVELYNLTNKPINLSDWYVQDASGGLGNTQITSSNTFPATTTIPANGFLVVYMNKAVWNNTGDTVKLYNADDVLVDSYAYSIDYDYCVLIPTPNDENVDTSDPDATCSTHQVPDNKSYARIPDGTGPWIDPIPTPGKPNDENQHLPDTINPELNYETVITSEAVAEITHEEPDAVATSSVEVIAEEAVTEEIIVGEIMEESTEAEAETNIAETETTITEEVSVIEEPVVETVTSSPEIIKELEVPIVKEEEAVIEE